MIFHQNWWKFINLALSYDINSLSLSLVRCCPTCQILPTFSNFCFWFPSSAVFGLSMILPVCCQCGWQSACFSCQMEHILHLFSFSIHFRLLNCLHLPLTHHGRCPCKPRALTFPPAASAGPGQLWFVCSFLHPGWWQAAGPEGSTERDQTVKT